MTLLKGINALVNLVRHPTMSTEELSVTESIPAGDQAVEGITRIIEQKIRASKETPVLRDQHGKQHGCVWAEFHVEDGLPDQLRVGLFKEPKTFPAWIRFSSLQERDDSKGDAQAFAIKLMGVEGEPALPEEDGKTQDFIMVNHPVFPIKNASDYLERQTKGMQASQCPVKQASSGLATWVPFIFPSKNPLTWRLRELSIVLTVAAKKVLKKPNCPLELQYWSMTPYQMGSSTGQAMKFFVKPAPTNRLGKIVPKSRNYMREAMTDYLASREAYFDFYVQLQSDPNSTPIEDPRINWQGASEYKAATIRIPAQRFDSAEQMEFGENLSYKPWHALAEHAPLGEVNFIRKEVYRRASNLRRDLNGVTNREEPTPDTYHPHLLDAQVPHHPLTVLVPIKDGEVQHLRTILDNVEDNLITGFNDYSPSTHSCRWVIVEDPDDEQGIRPHLLFTCNYEGRFDYFVRELVKIASECPQVEAIWDKCEGYVSGTSRSIQAYSEFLLSYSDHNAKPPVYYTAYRNRTVSTIRNSRNIREKLEDVLDSSRFQIDAITRSLFIHPPLPMLGPPDAVKAMLSKIGLFLIEKLFRVIEFLIGIRSQYRDPQMPIVIRETLKSDEARYAGLRNKEDRGPQNELTTLVAIRSNWYSKLLLRAILVRASQRAKRARGSLSNITTIHFLRWIIFDLDTKAGSKKSYLYFESHYNGSWDSYIDDFVKNARSSMNLVWGNCIGFPKGGCEDIESFKEHIRAHQFPAQIFYSAYPNSTVETILSDLQVRDTVEQSFQSPSTGPVLPSNEPFNIVKFVVLALPPVILFIQSLLQQAR
jgi:hypothetical protein